MPHVVSALSSIRTVPLEPGEARSGCIRGGVQVAQPPALRAPKSGVVGNRVRMDGRDREQKSSDGRYRREQGTNTKQKQDEAERSRTEAFNEPTEFHAVAGGIRDEVFKDH